jgi:hypothetical protein
MEFRPAKLFHVEQFCGRLILIVAIGFSSLCQRLTTNSQRQTLGTWYLVLGTKMFHVEHFQILRLRVSAFAVAFSTSPEENNLLVTR